MISTMSWVLRVLTRWFRWYTSADFASGLGGEGLSVELHSITAQHYTFYFLSLFSFIILTILILFIENISFRVMCRERAWLFESGIVFVQRKGMTFKVRHGVFVLRKDMTFEARHSPLTSLNLPQLTLLFTVWVPTIMSVGQALSVPMSKAYIFFR